MRDKVQVIPSTMDLLNPSNAEATQVQSTSTQRFLKTI